MSVRTFVRETVEWYLAVTAFIAMLAGSVLLYRYVAAAGVFRVAVLALALAVFVILVGSRWLRPLLYAGIPLAWLAIAVVFVERLTAFGLNGWLAAGAWTFANIVAAVVYDAVRDESRSSTAQRSLLYVGLFLAWPATAILFAERGSGLGLGDWTIVGGWLLASGLALVGYGQAWERSVRDFAVLVSWLGLTVLVIDRGTAFGLNPWIVVGGWLLASWLTTAFIPESTGDETDGRPASARSVTAIQPAAKPGVLDLADLTFTASRDEAPHRERPPVPPRGVPASSATHHAGYSRAVGSAQPRTSDASDESTDEILAGLAVYALVGGIAAMVFWSRVVAVLLFAAAVALMVAGVTSRMTDRFTTRMLSAAVAAVSVGGLAVALLTGRAPGLLTGRFVAMLGTAAVGLAILKGLVALPHRPLLKPLVLACHGVMVVGAVAFAYPPARLVAAVVIAVGLAGFLLTLGLLLLARALAQHGDPSAGHSPPAPAVILLLIIAACVPLTGLAVTSAAIQGGGSHVRYYGTTAEVQVPSSCTSVTRVGRGGISYSPTMTCNGATWSVDGWAVNGTLRATREELGAGMFVTVRRVRAYVYGDRAYTEGASSPASSSLVALANVPPRFAISSIAGIAAIVVLTRHPMWWPRPQPRIRR